MKRTNILEYLEETAKKYPGKAAFSDDLKTLTFSGLLRKARSIGSGLLSGCVRGDTVAILMHKSPDVIAAFLGCVYAGCIYVPLDETMPTERINSILRTCRAKSLIVDEKCKKKLSSAEFDGAVFDFDEISESAYDEEALNSVRGQSVDTDPVYIVFTSGSTGTPKGVLACHRSVIDYAEALSEVIRPDETTVFGNQSPFYFDACLKEILLTLKYGCSTWLIPKTLFMFPVRLMEYLNEKRINTVCWVASALSIVSSVGTFDVVKPEYLRTVAFGSEVFPVKQLNRWRSVLPNARFINLYGPTECTGMSCYYEIERDFSEDEPVPIGRPFKNTKIFLLNEDGTEGNEGEIVIGGTCVTYGYYNDPERTAAAFVQNPLNPYYRETVYRTGDMGKRNENGELLFLGRKDTQIKLKGHRIELGEIESAAASFDGVSLCVCLFIREKERLELLYCGTALEGDVSRYLKERLPKYMLPSAVTCLKAMPFTDNGKIDRKKLKEMLADGKTDRDT